MTNIEIKYRIVTNDPPSNFHKEYNQIDSDDDYIYLCEDGLTEAEAELMVEDLNSKFPSTNAKRFIFRPY